MSTVEALLHEFDGEMRSTRRVLERVPVADGEWTPHPKSRTLLQLATHVADIPVMATRIATLAEWDGAGPRPDRAPLTDNAGLLAAFDQHVSEARAALAGLGDAELAAPWTFKFKGRELFTIPRTDALRRMSLSHLIHHRGQLTVYLRLRDVPLPTIYGPSADEPI